jgi:hypothetical protein
MSETEVRSIGGVGPVETACYTGWWVFRKAHHEWGKWFHGKTDKPYEWVRLCKNCPCVDYGESAR